MARANKRTSHRSMRNVIHSRRLAAARKTEDAWEAAKVAPLREFIRDTREAGVGLDVVKADLRKILSKWPTKNKTKRGFLVWGITKSMRSRSRRELNEILVAD